jgi:hypothetical protein
MNIFIGSGCCVRCDELAHSVRQTSPRDYSCRKVIKTMAARSTPKASKPVVTCPKAMLSKVVAAVAAPINSGIGTFRRFDFRGEDADVTVHNLPVFP